MIMALRIPHWVSPSRSANKTRMETTAMRTKMVTMLFMTKITMFVAIRTVMHRFSTLAKFFLHLKTSLLFLISVYNM